MRSHAACASSGSSQSIVWTVRLLAATSHSSTNAMTIGRTACTAANPARSGASAKRAVLFRNEISLRAPAPASSQGGSIAHRRYDSRGIFVAAVRNAVQRSTIHRLALIGLLLGVISASRAVAQAAQQADASAAQRGNVETAAADAGSADNEWTRWTSGRYRITPGDVLELSFPFVPELNQAVTVQPDGYVSLKELPDMRIQGRTVAQVKADLLDAYGQFVRDPVVTVTLKEFQGPYFIAGGEVTKPGRYDLRGATTLTEALALAGGPVRGANLSRVVVFRRATDEQLETKQIDVRSMYAKRDLSEDLLLRPGDMLFVPKGVLGKLAPMLEVLRRY